jgi:regulator of sigma E protease
LSLLTASHLAIFPRFAVVLCIMVVVHELGHFIAAKLCGVRVEAFAIGFGKRLFGVVHNGTDYCVNLIPLGGYVKMTNETPEVGGAANLPPQQSNDPGDFQNHPRWQRTIIAVAGPVANFILAFVLMAGLYMFNNQVPAFVTQPAVADFVAPDSAVGRTGIKAGDRIVHFDTIENPTWGDLEQRGPLDSNQETAFSFVHNGQRVDTKLFIANKAKPEDLDFTDLGIVPLEQSMPVQVKALPDKTRPAALAGFQPNDIVLAIDDLHPHSVDALLAYLQDRAGKPSVVTLERTDDQGKTSRLAVPIVPFYGDGQRGKLWMIGFQAVPPPTTVKKLPLTEALAASWTDNVKNSRLIFDVLHRLFTRQVSVKSLSSPVGMAVQVNEAFEAPGSFPIIATMAMISLNLGIFNLLPIPILDGGMILFLAIESLMRRDLNQAVKERVYQVAFVCLVLFAAMVIFNDITKLLPTHLKG